MASCTKVHEPFRRLFLNEPSPKDGFVCENHVVSFAVPLIFKILESEAQSKTHENKTSEEQDGKHPPCSLCWMKTSSFIFLTRFVLFWVFFPSMEKSLCGLGLREGFSLHALPQPLRSAEALE